MSGSGPIYEYQRELTAKLDAALRERDEARAEVETLRAAIDGEPWGGAVLKQQRDEAIKKLGVTLEELWAMEKQRDEARAEVERLKRDWLEMAGAAAAENRARLMLEADAIWDGFAERAGQRKRAEAAAYQRGAEAMREASLRVCNEASFGWGADDIAEELRALPTPEDKS
jgi:hypothetical protein